MSKVVKAVFTSPLSLIDKDLGKAATAAFLVGAGIVTVNPALIAAGVSQGAAVLAKTPKASLAALDRLNASLVPSAPRKIAFGTTALATDIRHVEPSGTNQEYVDYIVHCASHRIGSFDEIWFEDKLAWTSAGGVQAPYAGYLTVSTILEGGAAAYHVVNGGSKWGAAQRLTGCASVHLRIKRTGNSKKAESPLGGGLPGRLTIVGNGMPLYDPRRDDTVPGGSGPMRIDDQSTWAFEADGEAIGGNHALQALAAHLGWKINGRVSVGFGMPAGRLDLEAFAIAANACDEDVALAAGGTQRRYEGGGLFSDFDDPKTLQQAFADATNGWFDDSTGKLGFYVAVNDLAGALPQFDDHDVLSGFSWKPFPAAPITVVRGRNPEPAAPALFQPTDYVEASLAPIDGIERALPLDLGLVQENRRAQRIATMALERQQYQGTFQATFGIRAWQLQRGKPIRFSFAALGWSSMPFRVVSWTANPDATVELTLRIENAAIYAWDTDETAPVTPAAPVTYDPRNAPTILGIGEVGAIVDLAVFADGTVRPGNVDTPAIVASAVTDGLTVLSSGLFTGTGANQTVATVTLPLAKKARVRIDITGEQKFYAGLGALNWIVAIDVNGVYVRTGGGDAPEALPTTFKTVMLDPGTHTIDFVWFAGSAGVTITDPEINIDLAYDVAA